MEDESRFYVGFYCGFRSTQPTVGIESFYRTHVILSTTFTASADQQTTTTIETTQPSIVDETDPNFRAVAKDYVIFNEIHNAYDDKHDWIEIKNISNREALLNTWEISIVTSSQDDIDIVSFADFGIQTTTG